LPIAQIANYEIVFKLFSNYFSDIILFSLGIVLIAAATWMQPNKLCRKNVKSLQSQCVEQEKLILKLHKNVVVKSTSSTKVKRHDRHQKTSFCHRCRQFQAENFNVEKTTIDHATYRIRCLVSFEMLAAFLTLVGEKDEEQNDFRKVKKDLKKSLLWNEGRIYEDFCIYRVSIHSCLPFALESIVSFKSRVDDLRINDKFQLNQSKELKRVACSNSRVVFKANNF